MVGILVLSLCFFTSTILAESNTTSNLKSNDLQKTNTVQKSWRMPLSLNHPIRKELERNPGVLIGRLEDFDLAKLRRGEFSPLQRAPQQKTSSRSPIDIFFRKQRESKPSKCNIEIQMIVSRPGHCIKLRDNTPACQNDEYVAINHDECS